MPMKGREAHINRLKRLASGETIAAAGRVVFVGADMIRAHSHKGISRGSVSGKNHVASKPGEYPNRDTGELQAGMTTKKTGPLTAEFRSSAPHSKPLEFGTSRVAARPHIRPSRDAVEPKIQKLFKTEIRKIIKGSGK